ncbi:MAG TPA: hypothetical protein VMX55_00175 [candidate division Zixibacteria bacterium]|nr:hypothetical protein [candidate division Zixibacteria bacterium]
MSYKTELEKAEKLEGEGKHLEAAKLYEDIGTKILREGGEHEKKEAPRIIAKSIARYMLADNIVKAQDLAFQTLIMKDEDPFLSLQIEAAISAKKQLVRAYIVDKIPKEINEDYEVLSKIPQNRKVMKMNSEITVKKTWEGTIFGDFKNKYDLIEQKYSNPKEMINFILSTKTGVFIIGAETASGQKIVVLVAVTFNKDPIEVLEIK